MSYRPLITCLLSTLLAGLAQAQDVKLYRSGDVVDPREVAAILAPVPVMKMRSIRLLDDVPAKQVTEVAAPGGGAAESTRTAPTALSLPVQFSFDSADILPPARKQLDALAEGIRMLPDLQSVVIEGHTDAAGSDQYNEQLSLRRAYAVKRYLVVAHQIDPIRLRAVGMGEYAPLPGRDPYAPENRRVQFRGE